MRKKKGECKKEYHVYCMKSAIPKQYSLIIMPPFTTLGTFITDEAALKRVCMAIDMSFSDTVKIEQPFQDEVRNRLMQLLLKITKDYAVITCATKFIYLLGVARQLDTPIHWHLYIEGKK